MEEHLKLIASLVPSITVQRIFDAIAVLEKQRQGLTMETFHQKVQNYHVSYGLVMFIFFFVFFTSTGIYLTQVLPHAMGFRENPLFCLIVCKKKSKVARRNNHNQDPEHHRQDDRNFEMDLMRPKDVINTLRIENLTKHYGSVRAV